MNERLKQRTAQKNSLEINSKFINWKKINRFSYYVSQTLNEFVVFVILLTSFFSCPFLSISFVLFVQLKPLVWHLHRIFNECTRFGRYTRFQFVSILPHKLNLTQSSLKFIYGICRILSGYNSEHCTSSHTQHNVTDDTMSLLFVLLREVMYASDICINPSTL